MANYRIVASESAEDLIELVNRLMDDGWQPIGGVTLAIETYENMRKGGIENERIWAQAMIQETPRT